jgi:hypothetical protein
MSTQVVTDIPDVAARRSVRARAVGAVGPLVVAAGAAWAFLQPYRLTILHPHGQGFWWLVVEPPILVMLVGALFQLLLAPTLVRDLQEAGGVACDAARESAPAATARTLNPSRGSRAAELARETASHVACDAAREPAPAATARTFNPSRGSRDSELARESASHASG